MRVRRVRWVLAEVAPPYEVRLVSFAAQWAVNTREPPAG